MLVVLDAYKNNCHRIITICLQQMKHINFNCSAHRQMGNLCAHTKSLCWWKLFKFGWGNTINASHKHTRFCTIKKLLQQIPSIKDESSWSFLFKWNLLFLRVGFSPSTRKKMESAKAALQMRIIEVNPCIQLPPQNKRKRNVDQTIKVFNLFLKIWLLKFAAKNVLPYT